MLRNYNGEVNRTVLRDLKKLCKVNDENFCNLWNKFAEDGQVSFHTNLDPFTGCPDEMSEINTLKSEEEIKEYLKKDFADRLSRYLKQKKPGNDYLLNAVIEFIKSSDGVYPTKEEMKQLEITAESKRVAELPQSNSAPKEITEQDIAEEILQLSEEIMEARRESNPKDIFKPVKPYAERMSIVYPNVFEGGIFHECHYGRFFDHRDYRCCFRIFNRIDIQQIRIKYGYDGKAYATAYDWDDKELDISLTDSIIAIHKGIVQIAKDEGIEFTSEIDYDKFQQ